MSLFKDDTGEPDEFELRVRFGCGCLVGVMLGFAALVAWVGDISARAVVPAMLGGGVAVGLLARRYGDRFWSALRSVLRWWP
jgi:hypothetical protein